MIVNGLLGHGKTLYSVAFGLGLAVRSGMPLYSNIKIEHEAYRPIRSIEHFASITHAVVLMDEAHRNLDSRLWTQNKDITDAVIYNRKRMKHCIYITPSWGNLDLRLRQIVPIMVVCSRPRGQSSITASWYDVQKADAKGNLPRVLVKTIDDPSIFYGLYDTQEEAPILPIKDKDVVGYVEKGNNGALRSSAGIAPSGLSRPRVSGLRINKA
jgi:hypothetical protein